MPQTSCQPARSSHPAPVYSSRPHHDLSRTPAPAQAYGGWDARITPWWLPGNPRQMSTFFSSSYTPLTSFGRPWDTYSVSSCIVQTDAATHPLSKQSCIWCAQPHPCSAWCAWCWRAARASGRVASQFQRARRAASFRWVCSCAAESMAGSCRRSWLRAGRRLIWDWHLGICPEWRSAV